MNNTSTLLESLYRRAKTNPKRVIFPESSDPRVIEAVRNLAFSEVCTPVVLSRSQSVVELEGVEVFDEVADYEPWLQRVYADYADRAKDKPSQSEVEQLFNTSPLMLAACLVRLGYADAGVAGSLATTADVLRAGIKGLGLAADSRLVSSTFLMELNGSVFTYGDCGVNPEPSEEQLADIAIASALSHKRLSGEQPKVAMLSFSTKGSARHDKVSKMQRATDLAQTIIKENQLNIAIDGELQFDAALLPTIAAKKAPNSLVAGKANVFIFPDLDAGNIAYKITERLAGAMALGPLLQGLAKPWMDLSRGCSADDIVNVAVIAAVLSQPLS
mgnify:CR=1 FL=1